ncbi:MAG: OsmC family protein [Marinovum algicola]|jgi:osmotically inducible protein OsmC|uniref:Osmotically inducible protein OsmC n=1 Tax=Marinovum algicola TaxID=42444 RepID=A0A975WBK6_9RHOB|nr:MULTISPECIES: OsmC family protein [Marinovum]AKO97504.1 peroxiredoxin, OsmC subfamily [Marinovum algicola DG 898]MDD9738593.1 OsmC family protein [Marinovum sp. SP66]MDD9744421.1 OsmC family protein [Marinovum sp. PR37]SEJ77853.1 osmotically inducible protein OsmC [Marinovum algicola]SLN59807.1 Peroxiredoxin OsmC [Marinovum algicola]
MIKKSGSANWKGGLKDGSGTVSTESGVLDKVNYGFNKRFEGEAGSNPEELIAAAHASCFSMALSMILGEAGLTADDIATSATVSLEQKDGGFAVTKSHLVLEAKVPGASEEDFMKAANAAKEGCPISKLLNAEITLDAKLA